MSNWSAVIISWAGADFAAEGASGHTDRVARLERRLRARMPRTQAWTVVWPAGAGPDGRGDGFAVELVIVAHICHFTPDTAFEVLDGFAWTYPGQVAVFHKDEHAGEYAHQTLHAWRAVQAALE
jgi:hypothetical protein